MNPHVSPVRSRPDPALAVSDALKPILRRVNRVRLRSKDVTPEPEELLDDAVVLWRAFEATIERTDSMRAAACDTVKRTIEYVGHRAVADDLPELLKWIRALHVFARMSERDIGAWLGQPGMGVNYLTRKRREIAELVDAGRRVEEGDRWNGDSAFAGWMLYQLRCAIIHPSVQTTDRAADQLLPRFVSTLIELTVVRVASIQKVEVGLAWKMFDRDRDQSLA